ncbi:Uncharacterized protein HZ326_23133 [Fusarium oxysporum f. sp. albedinis]|nr:Uncharacterized protein HZ326_23133 [Fusarium oxysporum f. sp. albedinis]
MSAIDHQLGYSHLVLTVMFCPEFRHSILSGQANGGHLHRFPPIVLHSSTQERVKVQQAPIDITKGRQEN